MSDILCAVCREPWDAYGVRHGDMAPWEAKLFRAGAGCPCCKGQAPLGADLDAAAEAHARSVLMNDAEEDATVFAAIAVVEAPERPPWQRPEDPMIWACEGCGSKVFRDLDVSRVEIARPGPHDFFRTYTSGIAWKIEGQRARQHEAWHGDEWEQVLQDVIAEAAGPGQRPGYGPVEDGKLAAPGDRRIDGRPYCPACASACAACGTLTLDDDMHMPEGKCHDGDAVCASCFDKIPRCVHCGAEWGEETPFNHEGYGPCCAKMCKRCKAEDGVEVMLDAAGDCPECLKRRAAVHAKRRRASHRRRIRRGW